MKGMRVIGVEASLRSTREQPKLAEQAAIGVGATILVAAMSDRNGVTDWYERKGWPAANSLAPQQEYVEYRKTVGTQVHMSTPFLSHRATGVPLAGNLGSVLSSMTMPVFLYCLPCIAL